MTPAIRISRNRRFYTVFRRLYSAIEYHGLRKVPTLHQSLNSIDLDEFRKNAFNTEKPVLIGNGSSEPVLPAGYKWFTGKTDSRGDSLTHAEKSISLEYLSPFAETILPYELYSPATKTNTKQRENDSEGGAGNVLSFLDDVIRSSPGSDFHRFSAPLAMFLSTLSLPTQSRPKLYIAQAQIADLPKELQSDLPTPHLVLKSGKGDIYDANIWIGIPTTYTPLHKDPNPNLFVQLAGKKRVRLVEPRLGMEIFRMVQMKIGQDASSSFRGYEMMEGLERVELEKAIWGDNLSEMVETSGLEATLEPGDALFIPEGWWHSIKSEGAAINASVNWWFR